MTDPGPACDYRGMLEALVFSFLSRDPGAEAKVYRVNEALDPYEPTPVWRWRVEVKAKRRSLASACTSNDLDAAIKSALEGVDFEPVVTADCTCSHDLGPDWVDDDCAYHEWLRLSEREAAE